MTREPPEKPSGPDIKDLIRARALEIGFDAVGFASAEADPADKTALAHFIRNGYQGDMAWMPRDDGRRGDPQALMPSARTVIVLGQNYGPEADPMENLRHPERGGISVYARGRDYHDVVKKRLKQLGRWVGETFDAEIKVFVDTAPVMEKPLAMRAGVGWQGKHTNLVSREHGSWLFLGEVFTSLDLAPDVAMADHCGSCDRCLRACPTDAFPEPYKMDARRCISYLTIEHAGGIADELMDRMGNRIYGCDDCLAACPWTKFGAPTATPELEARDALKMPALADLATLDDAAFRAMFSGSPIKRTGRDRFVRNVLIAIGNSGDASLLGAAEALLDDPSPLVASAAKRAVERLASDFNGSSART